MLVSCSNDSLQLPVRNVRVTTLAFYSSQTNITNMLLHKTNYLEHQYFEDKPRSSTHHLYSIPKAKRIYMLQIVLMAFEIIREDIIDILCISRPIYIVRRSKYSTKKKVLNASYGGA